MSINRAEIGREERAFGKNWRCIPTAPAIQFCHGVDTWDSVSGGNGFFRTHECATGIPGTLHQFADNDRRFLRPNQRRRCISPTLCGE